MTELSSYGRVVDNKQISPIILGITATPTNITKEIFGSPIYSYSLAKYLASEYSPWVSYKIVLKSAATQEEIQEIQAMVELAKTENDILNKKRLIENIEQKFQEIMVKVPDIKALVSDLLNKINSSKWLWETIIFTKDTEEATEVMEEINKQLWKQVAVDYHSYTDKKWLVNNKIKSQEVLKQFFKEMWYTVYMD